MKGTLGLFILILHLWTNTVNAQTNPRYWINDAKRTIKSLIETPTSNATAKNVVLIAVDGLDLDSLAVARQDIGDSAFESWPHVAMSKTFCVDSQGPDRACAATAILSGVKTRAKLVGLSAKARTGKCLRAPGNRIRSLLDYAAAAGKRTGIVTNSRLTGPTVAAAYAHSASSDWEGDVEIPIGTDPLCKDIALQLVDGKTNYKFNVLMGGGRRYFTPNTTADLVDGMVDPYQRQDGNDIIATWKSDKTSRGATSAVLLNKTDLATVDTASTDYLLGLFSKTDFDAAGQNTDEPTLAEMTSKALGVLSRGSDGYFLYIEHGGLGRALQSGYGGQVNTEVDEINSVISELTLDGETLVIVTGVRGSNIKLTGNNDVGVSALGLSTDTDQTPTDGKPRTSIQFSTGPGYTSPRDDLTSAVFAEGFVYPSGVPMTRGTMGAQDVPVFATGPMSYLFQNTHDQNYVAHAASYGMCTGLYNRCVKKNLNQKLFKM